MFKIVFLFFLIPTICFGAMYTEIRDCSVTNIPAAYASAGGQLISSMQANNICCINKTGSTLRLCFRANGAAACGDDWYLENGDGFCFEKHMLANSLFAKGESGAITSGILACHTWLN